MRITLKYNINTDETTITTSTSYKSNNNIHRLDFLKDCIWELEQEYNKLLEQKTWQEKKEIKGDIT